MNESTLLLGMFAVTFSVRYILFAAADKIRFPPWLSNALGFVPPVVLCAIIAPAVTMPQGELWLSWRNPWILASLVAIITALVRKDLLTTIVVGMAAFAFFRFGLGL